jgi:hypothetical protein
MKTEKEDFYQTHGSVREVFNTIFLSIKIFRINPKNGFKERQTIKLKHNLLPIHMKKLGWQLETPNRR